MFHAGGYLGRALHTSARIGKTRGRAEPLPEVGKSLHTSRSVLKNPIKARNDLSSRSFGATSTIASSSSISTSALGGIVNYGDGLVVQLRCAATAQASLSKDSTLQKRRLTP